MVTRLAHACLGSVVGLAIGVVLLRLLAPTAEASHPWLSHTHLVTIHSASELEEYCVQVDPPNTVHFNQMSQLIREALWLNNPSESWDGLAERRIWFWPGTGLQCDQDAVGRARSEIEYRLITNCTFSRAWMDGTYIDDSLNGGWTKAQIRLCDWNLRNAFIAHHTINHETGHALGLNDGGPTIEPTDPGVRDKTCSISIMHSGAYGCTDLEWPTSSDRHCVVRLATLYSGLECPYIYNITPPQVAQGSAPITVTITGANFLPGARVQWGGREFQTTFSNRTRITFRLTAADLASSSTGPIRVVNPAPDHSVSNEDRYFTVTAPSGSGIQNVVPSQITAGSTGFRLAVNGSNFNTTSSVRWNGSSRMTHFIGSTRVEADILASEPDQKA